MAEDVKPAAALEPAPSALVAEPGEPAAWLHQDRPALAQEGGGDEELPPNYAACCNSTDLASCDCVNKQHIRALFAKGGE